MSNRPHPGSERPFHGPFQSFDLEAEISRLRGEKEWQTGQRNAVTLRKGGGMNLVLLAMKAGDKLEEHSAPGSISLVVREGRVRFTTADGSAEAGPETLLACDAGVRHSVEALSDAVFLINLARSE
jgi:quercetin dioxygenase-like cupin family protein